MTRKRKIFNIFLVIFLVLLVLILGSMWGTTGTNRLIFWANQSKNPYPFPGHEFYIKIPDEKIVDITSNKNKENLLIITDADEYGGFLKNLKCGFTPESSKEPLPCKHYYYKENGTIKAISDDDFKILSEQNITKVIIRHKYLF
ncbi:hypothetical protein OFO08_01925 [Campylobacter sp. JMF_10 EL2]|uniref:hypothetical protein n=2 Tax=unclassified Campylobacter TaxID=2593542 RepID=UPI0022E99EEE|nr:hypothetical protein [Campylobacter sp. JMF_10 EL2]MDA3072984.1 hypothetical protein [Campylobacter sp. JMF_10 EL2]